MELSQILQPQMLWNDVYININMYMDIYIITIYIYNHIYQRTIYIYMKHVPSAAYVFMAIFLGD